MCRLHLADESELGNNGAGIQVVLREHLVPQAQLVPDSELVVREAVRVGGTGDPDGFQNTLAAQLVVDAVHVELGRGFVEVGFDAAHVVHAGLVDRVHQRPEGVLELSAKPLLLGRAAPRLGLDARFEQLLHELASRAGHNAHDIGAKRVFVLLCEPDDVVLHRPGVVANGERLLRPAIEAQ